MTQTTVSSAPLRSRLRPLWPGAALLFTVLVGVLAAAWNHYRQPEWHTFVSDPNRNVGMAFVISYPDGWQPPPAVPLRGGFALATIAHTPPEGPLRWLRENVFYQHSSDWDMEQVNVSIMRMPDATPERLLTRIAQGGIRATSGMRADGHRLTHPLGPAYEQMRTLVTDKSWNGFRAGTHLVERNLYIGLRSGANRDTVLLSAGCVMPQHLYETNRAAIDGIFHSIRVIRQ